MGVGSARNENAQEIAAEILFSDDKVPEKALWAAVIRRAVSDYSAYHFGLRGDGFTHGRSAEYWIFNAPDSESKGKSGFEWACSVVGISPAMIRNQLTFNARHIHAQVKKTAVSRAFT